MERERNTHCCNAQITRHWLAHSEKMSAEQVLAALEKMRILLRLCAPEADSSELGLLHQHLCSAASLPASSAPVQVPIQSWSRYALLLGAAVRVFERRVNSWLGATLGGKQYTVTEATRRNVCCIVCA